MSDWELVTDHQPQQDYSGWEVVPSAPAQKSQKESYASSLAHAPFRLGSDLIQSGIGFLRDLPGYLQAAPSEISGAANIFTQHPGRAAKQGLAGLAELGNSLLNMPRGTAEYAANRLNLIPEQWAEAVPQQGNIESQINGLLGAPEMAGEKLIRGTGRNALNILAAAKAASALNPSNISAKNISEDVLRKREQAKNLYGEKYKKIFEEASKQGLSDLRHTAQKIDMKTLRKFSTEKNLSSLEDFIKKPTLENAHGAKSDLMRLKRSLDKIETKSPAQAKQIKALGGAINHIESSMFRNNAGAFNEPLYNQYRGVQEGYRKDVVPYTTNKAINKFIANESTPEDLVKAISGGKFYAQAAQNHPYLKIRNALAKNKFPLGAGAAAIAGLPWILGNEKGEPYK